MAACLQSRLVVTGEKLLVERGLAAAPFCPPEGLAGKAGRVQVPSCFCYILCAHSRHTSWLFEIPRYGSEQHMSAHPAVWCWLEQGRLWRTADTWYM